MKPSIAIGGEKVYIPSNNTFHEVSPDCYMVVWEMWSVKEEVISVAVTDEQFGSTALAQTVCDNIAEHVSENQEVE